VDRREGTAVRLRTLVAALVVLCAAATPAGAAPGPWIGPGQVAVSPDGHDLYATGYRTLSFRRDLETGGLTQIDELGPPASSIAIAPDGSRVYLGAFSGWGAVGAAIHILSRDSATGLLTHESTFVEDAASHIAPGQVTDLAISPDGRFLYVAQERENAVLALAIDPQSGGLRLEQALYGGPDGQRGLDSPPQELSLAPDGSSLYVGANEPLSFARDAQSGHLTPLPAPAGYTQSQAWHIAASPDGRRVYAGIAGFTIYERDPATGQLTELGQPQMNTGCTDCEAGPLAVSPDSGSILQVFSREDQLLRFSRTDGGAEQTGVFTGFAGASDGTGLTWSPDGRFAYVSGGERFAPGYSSNIATGGSIAVLRSEGNDLVSAGSVDPTPPIPGMDPVGVSIDNGTIYTNDPHVKLHITLPFWTPASFRVSNDPNLDSVRPTRVTAQSADYDWRLDTASGPVRSVKHVWVRFTGNGLYPDSVVSDDVILDRTPPQIVSAALARAGKRSKVTLRAKDNRSGVRQVQVTRDRRNPGKARRFAKQVLVPGAPRVVYVRVADGAGNESRWRRVKR
jgi:DNA-binding beta-propeller fold protein YncE